MKTTVLSDELRTTDKTGMRVCGEPTIPVIRLIEGQHLSKQHTRKNERKKAVCKFAH